MVTAVQCQLFASPAAPVILSHGVTKDSVYKIWLLLHEMISLVFVQGRAGWTVEMIELYRRDALLIVSQLYDEFGGEFIL